MELGGHGREEDSLVRLVEAGLGMLLQQEAVGTLDQAQRLGVFAMGLLQAGVEPMLPRCSGCRGAPQTLCKGSPRSGVKEINVDCTDRDRLQNRRQWESSRR